MKKLIKDLKRYSLEIKIEDEEGNSTIIENYEVIGYIGAECFDETKDHFENLGFKVININVTSANKFFTKNN